MITKEELNAINYSPLPKAIRKELDRLGVTQADAASMLRIDERTMRRYLQDPETGGHTPIPFPTLALLKSIKP